MLFTLHLLLPLPGIPGTAGRGYRRLLVWLRSTNRRLQLLPARSQRIGPHQRLLLRRPPSDSLGEALIEKQSIWVTHLLGDPTTIKKNRAGLASGVCQRGRASPNI